MTLLRCGRTVAQDTVLKKAGAFRSRLDSEEAKSKNATKYWTPKLATVIALREGWLAILLGRQGRLDCLGDFSRVRCGARFEALKNLAVRAEKKFAKVPLDVTGERG